MTPADHLQILSVAPRYAAAVDARELATAAALFAPGAVLVLPEPPGRMGPVREHHGLDAIAAALAEVTAVELTVHEIVGQVVDPGPTPDEARGHVRCIAHHVTGEQDVVWHLHYDDVYVRRPDGWRIARRALTVDLVEICRVRPHAAMEPKENS